MGPSGGTCRSTAPALPKWLTRNALLTSLAQLEGHFLPHNRKTTISIFFFFFPGQKKKALTQESERHSMRAVCVSKKGCHRSCAALQGTDAAKGTFPGVRMRGPGSPAKQVRRSIVHSYSGPGSLFEDVSSLRLTQQGLRKLFFHKGGCTWHRRQKIQNRDF